MYNPFLETTRKGNTCFILASNEKEATLLYDIIITEGKDISNFIACYSLAEILNKKIKPTDYILHNPETADKIIRNVVEYFSKNNIYDEGETRKALEKEIALKFPEVS